MDELFNKIGLNKNDQTVYLAILGAGKIPHTRVAKLTGINRTTVYSIAKKLKSMGLIAEDIGQKIEYLTAENPEKLATLFEGEERRINEGKQAAQQLAEQLSHLASVKNYSVPRIKFIEEIDLNKYLYDQYPKWRNSVERYDNTWWGFHDSSFTEKYGGWIDWCWKHASGDLRVRFFSNDAPVEQAMLEKHAERLVRSLPSNVNFDSSLWVAGDYILMVQTRERPHYLVEVYDTVFARNQRELFKGLWEYVK